MDVEVEGIILYETPFQESSKIIQVLTKEYGLIGILCRGVLKPKSKLRAKLNKFSRVNFNLIYRENKLGILVSADIIDNYSCLRSDIVLISYLTYLCELTYQVAKQTNSLKLYNNLTIALEKINNGLDPLVITNMLEIKYLDYLGIKLELDKCVVCHSSNNILTLNSELGGVICQNCYIDGPIVNKKTLNMIKRYYYFNLENITNINVSAEVKKDINNFLTNYYEKYTGLYTKSKHFLNNLLNL